MSDTYLKLTWEGTSEAIVPTKETFEKYIRNPSDAIPLNLGTPNSGTSLTYSRSDHVHKLPTASDINAIPLSGGDTTGNLYVGAGDGQKEIGVKFQDTDNTSGRLFLFNNTSTEFRGLYDSKNGAIIAIAQDGSDIHFNGDISGNANTATKLKTPRTITLSGDATGSANFDGSANINIDVSVPSSASWDGGNINNSATILADGASDLKYWGIQYIDDTGATQHFRMNASNNSDYLSLTSSDDRIGTIISVKYDGTSTQFRGNSETANALSVPRTISLSGAVTGSVGFDGSSNVTIDTTASSSLVNTSSIAQAKSGNFYVLLANGSSGQRNLGVQFYKDNTLTQLYLMYNSSTNYSSLYHSEYGSVVSINEDTGNMNFNGSAESAGKLSTSRQIRLTGGVTGSINTDLSGTVAISTTVASAPASAITSGTLPVSRGGTGATSFTGSRVIVSNSSGNLTVSTIDTTHLGYLSTVTSNIQTQLNGKAASSHDHAASAITSGLLPGSRGGTGNDNNTTNTIIVNNRAICYGSFSTGRYNANVAYGNHFYGNVAVDVKWPVTFTSAPIVLLTVLGATEGVLNVEVGSRSTTRMTSIRVHRIDAVLDIDPFNISYIACGPTSST